MYQRQLLALTVAYNYCTMAQDYTSVFLLLVDLLRESE